MTQEELSDALDVERVFHSHVESGYEVYDATTTGKLLDFCNASELDRTFTEQLRSGDVGFQRNSGKKHLPSDAQIKAVEIGAAIVESIEYLANELDALPSKER